MFGVRYAHRLRKSRQLSEERLANLWGAKTFASLVLREGLQGRAVYVYDGAGLEVMTAAKQAGMMTILEQTIASRHVVENWLTQEHDLHPGWEKRPETGEAHLDELLQREQREWQLADLILCGSEFVRESIAYLDGPVDRCAVVPYGENAPFTIPASPERGPARALRVLTVGTVSLRKGAPYLAETARRLGAAAEFRAVGAVRLLPNAAASLAEHVELLGQVPRTGIGNHFGWADVFFLPSVCEGSAEAINEALRCGLPVVTTPNAGSIVRDGIEGYLVAPRDVAGMVDRLRLFKDEPDLRHQMAEAATRRSSMASMAHYGERLLHAVGGACLSSGPARSPA